MSNITVLSMLCQLYTHVSSKSSKFIYRPLSDDPNSMTFPKRLAKSMKVRSWGQSALDCPYVSKLKSKTMEVTTPSPNGRATMEHAALVASMDAWTNVEPQFASNC